jgi:hypothetical protein
MSAQFCRLQIVVQPDRPFNDPVGEPVKTYPLPTGGVLLHWADAPRAMGWFKEAWRLLNDADRLKKLGEPVNTTDKGANNKQAGEQFQYVLDVLAAIARGYNMLNIVWHNDPIARELYRVFLAGPPQTSGMAAGNVFDAKLDYNPNWYTKDEFLPHAQDTAWLQKAAIQGAKGKAGDRFAPSALLVVAAMDTLPENGPVALSRRVFNAPVLTTLLQQRCPTGLFYKAVTATDSKATLDFTAAIDFPWRKRCESGSNGFGTWPRGIMPDGSELPEGFDDWRAAYRGDLYRGNLFDMGDSGITAPLTSYRTWLHAWVSTLVNRSAVHIIQDARAYTAWQNFQTLTVNASALAQIEGLGSIISGQQHAPDAGWQIASGSLAAIGAVAGSTGNPVGAAIGLIAGASAAVISVTDSIIVKGTKDIGRDDLGRYKPQLERAWLSGNAAEVQASTGAPGLPDFVLNDPPGKGVVWSPEDCPDVPIADTSGTDDDDDGDGPNLTTKSIKKWWRELPTSQKWAVGGAAGLAGVSLISAMSRPSPAAASGPGRNRRGQFVRG